MDKMDSNIIEENKYGYEWSRIFQKRTNMGKMWQNILEENEYE